MPSKVVVTLGSAYAPMASNDNDLCRPDEVSGATSPPRLRAPYLLVRASAREMSFFEFVRDLAATHPDPDPFLCLVLDAEGGVMTSAAHGEWKKDEKDTAVPVAVKTLHAMTCVHARRCAPSQERWRF